MAAIKTMLVSPTYGKVYFDAVFNLDHRADVVVTEHPVQTGASVADHAHVEPREVTLEIGMSDTAQTGNQSRSVSAFQVFMDLLNLREPLKLVTRLYTYSNMVITSISAPDDYTTMNALKATIILREVKRVTVNTIKIQQKTSGSTSGGNGNSGNSSNSGKTNGKTNPPKDNSTSTTQTNQSILNQIVNGKK